MFKATKVCNSIDCTMLWFTNNKQEVWIALECRILELFHANLPMRFLLLLLFFTFNQIFGQSPVFNNSFSFSTAYGAGFFRENQTKEVSLMVGEDTLYYAFFDSTLNQITIRKHLENKFIKKTFPNGWTEETSTRNWGSINERILKDDQWKIRQMESWNTSYYKCLEYDASGSLTNEFLRTEEGLIQKAYENRVLVSMHSAFGDELVLLWRDSIEGAAYQFSIHKDKGIDVFDEVKRLDGSFTYKQDCRNGEPNKWLMSGSDTSYYTEHITNNSTSYKWSQLRGVTSLDSANGKVSFSTPTNYGRIKQEFEGQKKVYEEKTYFQYGHVGSARTKRTEYKMLKNGNEYNKIELFHPGDAAAYYYAHYDGDSNQVMEIKTSFYDDGSIKKEVVKSYGKKHRVHKRPNPNPKKFRLFKKNELLIEPVMPYLPHVNYDYLEEEKIIASIWYRWYPVIDSFPEPFIEELLYFQKGDSVLMWTDLRKQYSYLTYAEAVIELNLDSNNSFSSFKSRDFNDSHPHDSAGYQQVQKTRDWLQGATPKYGMNATIRVNKETPQTQHVKDILLPMRLRWEAARKVNERKLIAK